MKYQGLASVFLQNLNFRTPNLLPPLWPTAAFPYAKTT
jgi:hypothetical protein